MENACVVMSEFKRQNSSIK